MHPHDMAKLGWLYAQEGMWDGEQIVSKKWVSRSSKPHIQSQPVPFYGYHWWIIDDQMYAAVGFRGQYIIVAKELNLVAVFTGDLPRNTIFIPLELMKQFIVPAAVSADALSEDEKEQTRLTELVQTVLTPFQDQFVWESMEQGFARDGLFKRTEPPQFMFEYPIGSQKQSTQMNSQVMRMRTPGGVDFAASVIKKPRDIELKDFGSHYYAEFLKQIGLYVRILSTEEKVLTCGTTGYQTTISWLYKGAYRLNSIVLASYINDHCVYVVVHSLMEDEKLLKILESLRFE